MSSGPTLRMKLNRRALMACRTGVSLSGYGYAGTDAGAACTGNAFCCHKSVRRHKSACCHKSGPVNVIDLNIGKIRMLLRLYQMFARIFRVLPKTRKVRLHDMEATFFVPINNHYVCNDLADIEQKRREPELYRWLRDLDDGAIFFDVGTSYGQESALASSPPGKQVRVFGFDCGLYQSHFCAL